VSLTVANMVGTSSYDVTGRLIFEPKSKWASRGPVRTTRAPTTGTCSVRVAQAAST